MIDRLAPNAFASILPFCTAEERAAFAQAAKLKFLLVLFKKFTNKQRMQELAEFSPEI